MLIESMHNQKSIKISMRQYFIILVSGISVCLSSAVPSSSLGIFGTRIRSPEDFETYVTEAREAYEQALATFETGRPSETAQGAVEDIKVISSLVDKVFLMGGIFRTIVDSHQDVAGIDSAGAKALESILGLQGAAMGNEALVGRIGSAVQLLTASEAMGFSDVEDKEAAKNALMIALDVVDHIKMSSRRTEGPPTPEMVQPEGRPLSELAGWEQQESVRVLRKMWQGTADSMAENLTAVWAANPGTMRYSTFMPKSIQGVSVKYVLEHVAAFAKVFLGLEMRLNESAFRIDEYSFAFDVLDGPEVIGTIYLRAEVRRSVERLSCSRGPLGLGIQSTPFSVAVISAVDTGASIFDTDTAVLGGDSAVLGGDSSITVSQTVMLERLKLDGSSYFPGFVYLAEHLTNFLAGPRRRRYASPAERAETIKDRGALGSYLSAAIVNDLIALIARDLQEAIGGFAVDAPRMQANGYTWWSYFHELEGAAVNAVTRLEFGSPEVAQVLGTTPDHFMLQRMAENRSDSPNQRMVFPSAYRRALSLGLATTVYKANFRGILFDMHRALIQSLSSDLIQSLRSDLIQSLNSESEPSEFLCESSEAQMTVSPAKVCDAANRLETHAGLLYLREFLNPRLRGGAPQSISILIPEAADAIRNGGIEDAVDFTSLVDELKPRRSVPDSL